MVQSATVETVRIEQPTRVRVFKSGRHTQPKTTSFPKKSCNSNKPTIFMGFRRPNNSWVQPPAPRWQPLPPGVVPVGDVPTGHGVYKTWWPLFSDGVWSRLTATKVPKMLSRGYYFSKCCSGKAIKATKWHDDDPRSLVPMAIAPLPRALRKQLVAKGFSIRVIERPLMQLCRLIIAAADFRKTILYPDSVWEYISQADPDRAGAAPSKQWVLDLTVCGDVEPNPGPPSELFMRMVLPMIQAVVGSIRARSDHAKTVVDYFHDNGPALLAINDPQALLRFLRQADPAVLIASTTMVTQELARGHTEEFALAIVGALLKLSGDPIDLDAATQRLIDLGEDAPVTALGFARLWVHDPPVFDDDVASETSSQAEQARSSDSNSSDSDDEQIYGWDKTAIYNGYKNWLLANTDRALEVQRLLDKAANVQLGSVLPPGVEDRLRPELVARTRVAAYLAAKEATPTLMDPEMEGCLLAGDWETNPEVIKAINNCPKSYYNWHESVLAKLAFEAATAAAKQLVKWGEYPFGDTTYVPITSGAMAGSTFAFILTRVGTDRDPRAYCLASAQCCYTVDNQPRSWNEAELPTITDDVIRFSDEANLPWFADLMGAFLNGAFLPIFVTPDGDRTDAVALGLDAYMAYAEERAPDDAAASRAAVLNKQVRDMLQSMHQTLDVANRPLEGDQHNVWRLDLTLWADEQVLAIGAPVEPIWYVRGAKPNMLQLAKLRAVVQGFVFEPVPFGFQLRPSLLGGSAEDLSIGGAGGPISLATQMAQTAATAKMPNVDSSVPAPLSAGKALDAVIEFAANPIGGVTEKAIAAAKAIPDAVQAFNNAADWKSGLAAAATKLGEAIIGPQAVGIVTSMIKGIFCEEIVKADPSVAITLAAYYTILLAEDAGKLVNTASFNTPEEAATMWDLFGSVDTSVGEITYQTNPWAGTTGMYDMSQVANNIVASYNNRDVFAYTPRTDPNGGPGVLGSMLFETLANWKGGSQNVQQMFRANQAGTDATSGAFMTSILRALNNKLDGYSIDATPMFLRVMLATCAQITVPGDNLIIKGEVVDGILPVDNVAVRALSARLNQAGHAGGNLVNWWNGSPNSVYANVSPAVNAKFISIVEFIGILNNNIAAPVGWEPSTWDQTTAIVPVTQDISRAGILHTFTLAHMHHPYMEGSTAAVRIRVQGQAVTNLTANANTRLGSLANNTVIAGPRDNVIYVAVDAGQVGTILAYTLQLPGGPNIPIGGINAAAVDISPSLAGLYPFAAAGWFNHAPLTLQYLSQMYHANGFSTAFALAAAHVRRFNPPQVVFPNTGSAMPGYQDALCGTRPGVSALNPDPVATLQGVQPMATRQDFDLDNPAVINNAGFIRMNMWLDPPIRYEGANGTYNAYPFSGFIPGSGAVERILGAAGYIYSPTSVDLPQYASNAGIMVRTLHNAALHVGSAMARSMQCCAIPDAVTKEERKYGTIGNPVSLWYPGSLINGYLLAAQRAMAIRADQVFKRHLVTLFTSGVDVVRYINTTGALSNMEFHFACNTGRAGNAGAVKSSSFLNLPVGSLCPGHLHMYTTGGTWITSDAWSTQHYVFGDKTLRENFAGGGDVATGGADVQRMNRLELPNFFDALALYKVDHNADRYFTNLFWSDWAYHTFYYCYAACYYSTIPSFIMPAMSCATTFVSIDPAITRAPQPVMFRKVKSFTYLVTKTICQRANFVNVPAVGAGSNVDNGWVPQAMELSTSRSLNPVDAVSTRNVMSFRPLNLRAGALPE